MGARSSHAGFVPAAAAVGFATAGTARAAAPAPGPVVAPTTGQMRSGHIEVDSLYGGGGGPMVVNSMNAPNNSTMQCGCENIDCPFCNQMMSIQGGRSSAPVRYKTYRHNKKNQWVKNFRHEC